MINDDENTNIAPIGEADQSDTAREADGDRDMDTVMAAGPRSGAAGVANAELGTSGPPAEALLTPEELAQTEVDGGAGLDPDAVSRTT